MTISFRAARKIRIHCPIAHETFCELMRGNVGAIEKDVAAAKVLAIIRGFNPLGDFDAYQGVFEVSFGVEGFTATDRAQPTAGTKGAATLSPTAVITTYVDSNADRSTVLNTLDELVGVHPWESPVIEFSDEVIQLAGRGSDSRRQTIIDLDAL